MAEPGGEGARIRALRLQKRLGQAALARQVGISPSYLNLIEHGRRSIGGKVLASLARALGTDAAQLSQGAEAALIDGLLRAAGGLPGPRDPAPEIDRIDALTSTFPGWSALVTDQAERLITLERSVASLGERLSHDPLLSASVHEVLSAVTAIRSTSAILAEDTALAPDWQARFHRNLHEDSRRLADSARSLALQLEDGATADRGSTTPQDEMETWLAARDFHIPELEGLASPEGDLPLPQGALPDGPAGQMLATHLRHYAQDACALPLEPFVQTLADTGPDPFRLSQVTGVAPAPVMRRLVSLPRGASPRSLGLLCCDAAGALVFRRPMPGFAVPRFGTGCPLWPLYDALRSLRPVSVRMQQADGGARPVRAFAVAELDHPSGPDGPGIVWATMLVVSQDRSDHGAPPPLAVGQTCRICPRAACPARSEPSILPEVAL